MEYVQLNLIMLRQKQCLFFEYYGVLPATNEVIEETTEPEEVTEAIDDYVETDDVEIIETTIDLSPEETNANPKVETPITDVSTTTESDNNAPTQCPKRNFY